MDVTSARGERYDVLLVSKNASQRISEHGVRAWVNYFQAMGLVKIVKETLSAEWTELYFEAWYSSHTMFYDGEKKGEQPVFLEACLRFGEKSWSPGYNDVDDVFFSVEFRGCEYPRVLDEVTSRTHDILHNNPRIISREHAGLPEHPSQEGVAVDRRRKRADRGSKKIGTRTEDL